MSSPSTSIASGLRRLSGIDYQRILLAVDLLLTPVIPFTAPSLAQLAELHARLPPATDVLRRTL